VRNAKIVCTLGPASRDPETVGALIRAGMDVARLNASHGTTAERRETVETVRRVAREVGRHVGVLLDLQGPEVRTADAPTVELVGGSHVELAPGDEVTSERVGVSASLAAAASTGLSCRRQSSRTHQSAVSVILSVGSRRARTFASRRELSER